MPSQVYVGGETLGGGDAPGTSQSLILTGDWPFQAAPQLGARIAKLCRQGLVRRDIVMEQGNVLRKIKNIAVLKKAKCEIFVLNKEGAPPGYDDHQRLVVLMGSDAQVAQGVMQIENLLGSVSSCSANEFEACAAAAEEAAAAAAEAAAGDQWRLLATRWRLLAVGCVVPAAAAADALEHTAATGSEVDSSGAAGPSEAEASEPAQAPDDYVCPITAEIMTDPVCAADGFTYERAAITKWLRAKDTSPITGAVLENKCLFPNNSLRSMIHSFVEAAAAAAAAAAAILPSTGGSGRQAAPLRGKRGVGRGGRGGRGMRGAAP